MWCSIAENCLNCRTFGKFNTLEFSLEWLKCFVSHWRFLFTFAFMLLLLMTVYVHLCSTFDCFTLVEGTADVAVWQMWLKLGCWRCWEMEHGQMLVLDMLGELEPAWIGIIDEDKLPYIVPLPPLVCIGQYPASLLMSILYCWVTGWVIWYCMSSKWTLYYQKIKCSCV